MATLRSTAIPTVLAVLLCAGCASQPSSSLDATKREVMIDLVMKCYRENHEELRSAYAQQVRASCREWATRQAGLTSI